MIQIRIRGLLLALLLLLAIAVGDPGDAWAQGRDWNQEYDPYVAGIGLAAGLTSGTGLAVRWPAFPQVMMGLAGGIWRRDEKSDWNFGVELHLVLRQAQRTRLFIGPSVAAYRDGADEKTDWNSSFGVGIEYLLKARLAFKADIGFTYQGDSGNVLPLPQAALFYYF